MLVVPHAGYERRWKHGAKQQRDDLGLFQTGDISVPPRSHLGWSAFLFELTLYTDHYFRIPQLTWELTPISGGMV